MLLLRATLVCALCLPLRLVKGGDPEFSVSYFKNLPAKLAFFEDTQSILYHDPHQKTVYVSSDEGKKWEEADIPSSAEVIKVIEHPFDNSYAFALTADLIHYRTTNRGKTWQSFKMPVPVSYVAQPLSFHSDPRNYNYVLYQGTKCIKSGFSVVCHDETYYTKDAFGDEPKLLLSDTSRCQFAHSTKDFKHSAHKDLIYCVAFESSSPTGTHSMSSSRLFSSTDFFVKDSIIEDLGIGSLSKGVLALAIVSKFAVAAIRDSTTSEMHLYVTVDTLTFAKAHFPHASNAQLRENAYTIVESTKHSLGVDVVLQDKSAIGTLFVSNSNGTYFVQSLKDTNRNDLGYVDYENIYGVDGVGIANVVKNTHEVENRSNARKILRSLITFDDGRSWKAIKAPSSAASCDTSDLESCSLHFHSVTTPHNMGRIFSSPAPGFVMGVGSIGEFLKPYDECDTFLSIDAGVTWKLARKEAHKYEFGDQGSIIVAVNDEERAEVIEYTNDMGNTWKSFKFGLPLRAKLIMQIPDSTSQKFILLGSLSRHDAKTHPGGRYVMVFFDFSKTRSRQCESKDLEKWYARPQGSACLMGHKQWYMRRKADVDCFVGKKFDEPVGHEEDCDCDVTDYECDYNFIRNGDKCEPAGPEPIGAGECKDPEGTYTGSSGYRKVPGNTCKPGASPKDARIKKPCSKAKPHEGGVIHQKFEFPAAIVQQAYFAKSTTILARLADYSIWQSQNEGYTWSQLFPEEKFLTFVHHKTPDRAYLITNTNHFYSTTNSGKDWDKRQAPTVPSQFTSQVLSFHFNSDNLIWTGDNDCHGVGEHCHAEAHYSQDNGRSWHFIEKYVRNCGWARDAELKVETTEIICESYDKKEGSQRSFNTRHNALQLVAGANFFRDKRKLFDNVVGFTKFSEYLLVAQYLPDRGTLNLQVSLDGFNFAEGQFPPDMHVATHSYTILESSTDSVFMHMTMSEPPAPYWGNILKSNSNGTLFGLSAENVNRDTRGYVDFEKLIGLDGIALINVVSNTADATRNGGTKELQSRITFNDGGVWKPLSPPKLDSLHRPYDCNTAKCALHIHGYTERFDARATYSSPSIVGVVMAVGNVGEKLLPYTESDTFLSRDAGLTWEEIRKDAHLWEFGDSGSVLVIANDEVPVDHVLYSTNEGKTWSEYVFTDQKVRVRQIITVSEDTSRRFILMGAYAKSRASVMIHLDFSALTSKQCKLSIDDPNNDDFELWSPSEVRDDACLFGRQTLYHRRLRDAQCYVGNQEKVKAKEVKNCICRASDFECEFNHQRNDEGKCVLVTGATPLPNDDTCRGDADYWYERTAYRKIPYSTCEDGERPDRGARHACPGLSGHGFWFWFFILILPFAFTFIIGYGYYRRSGMARGTIRLPGPNERLGDSASRALDTLASIPWALVGLGAVAWENLTSLIRTSMPLSVRSRGNYGYRNVNEVDEDAQILRFTDDD